MTVYLKKYSADFEEEFYDRIAANIKEKYKKQIINELNMLTNGNNFTDFKDLILADHERLQRFVNDVNACNSEKFISWNKLHDNNNSFSQEEKERLQRKVQIFNKIYNWYDSKIKKMKNDIKLNLEILGKVHVCPYCNRDYINERDEKYPGGHLDHFFPRSEYPFLSICLYNLIPCCSICNTKKGEEILNFSPFMKSDEDSNLKFEFDFINGAWRPTINPLDPNFLHDLNILGLKKAYIIHQDELTMIAKNRERYSKFYEEYLSGIIGVDKDYIKTLVEDLIFGDIQAYDYERFKNTPLSYLKHQFYIYINYLNK